MSFESLQRFLPSKKVLVGIAIVVGIFVIIFGVKQYKKYLATLPEHEFGSSIPEVSKSDLQKAFDIDSDQDGISDWEEALWATDPLQKDTDGDGVSDGIFILAQKEQMRQVMPSIEAMPESGIEVFDRQFYATVAYLEQSGQLTDERKQSLTDLYTTYVMQPINIGMTRADIKIVTDDTVNIQNYLIQIDDFFQKNELIPTKLPDLMQAIRFGGVPEELYASILVPYGRMITVLKSMQVPERFADSHLALLNAIAIFKVGVLDGLGKVAEEPVYAMRAVAQFKEAGAAVVAATENLQNALSAFTKGY